MSLRDDLIAARALIADEAHWCKGSHDKNGARCAMGAVIAVTEATDRHAKRYDALWAALNEQLPARFSGMIRAYNDANDTDHADILALFDRAIEAAGA